MTAEKVTEQELVDRAIAPRVSKIEIDTIINEGKLLYDHAHHPLTLCIFQHPNGFWLIGHSAPASPENFDEAIGERLALERVISQLWQLEGFMLRSKLHEKELADESGQSYAHLGAPPEPRPEDLPPDEDDLPPATDEPDEPDHDPDDDVEPSTTGEGTSSAEEENPNREPPPRVASGDGSPGEDAVAEAQRRDYAKDSPRGMTGYGS